MPLTTRIISSSQSGTFAKHTHRGVVFLAHSMLFVLGTHVVSLILLLIGIIEVLSEQDIGRALVIILSVMSSKNPLIYIPAILLTLFSLCGYILFFLGWFFIVFGQKEIGGVYSPGVLIGSISAFIYLIIYLVKLSASAFTLLGFATLAFLQEIFIGAGLLFNIFDAVLVSVAMLQFAKHIAFPTTLYHLRNTGYMYIGGAASTAIGYVVLFSGIIFSAVSAPLVIVGLVLLYLGFAVMITALMKFYELYFVIVKRIESGDYIHHSERMESTW